MPLGVSEREFPEVTGTGRQDLNVGSATPWAKAQWK